MREGNDARPAQRAASAARCCRVAVQRVPPPPQVARHQVQQPLPARVRAQQLDLHRQRAAQAQALAHPSGRQAGGRAGTAVGGGVEG